MKDDGPALERIRFDLASAVTIREAVEGDSKRLRNRRRAGIAACHVNVKVN